MAMGPIVNLVIWAVFSLLGNSMYEALVNEAIAAANPSIIFDSSKLTIIETLLLIAHINGFLAIFNLIPVQPLDGGRLFQLAMMRFLPGGLGVVSSSSS